MTNPAARIPRRFILLVSLLWLLSGCNPSAEAGTEIANTGTQTPLPTLTRMVESSATVEPPTATVLPSATATLIPSPVVPTATPVPTHTPTASATATLVPTATSEPSPTAAQSFMSATPWPTPDGPLTWDERALLFDELWNVVNERYIDANFYGLDWYAQREYYRPRALAAPNDSAYYQLLKEMVWSLEDEHSRFMTPDEAFEHFALARNEARYGGIGLYTMPLSSGALVLQVNPGSPAERAGIRMCDRIVTFNGSDSWTNEGGAIGSTATLEVQRPGAGSFTVTVQREEIAQVLDVPGWVLPNRASRIGYVRIDTLWVFEMPAQLRARIGEMEASGPLDGLVIDLRSNLGGWRPVLQGILGTFISGDLGVFSGRIESEILFAPRADEPPPSHPNLPLAVLVGPRTESYAEVLAAVLQKERGAIVIGQQTRGNVETIFPRRLPFGARVWIAEQGFTLNDGTLLEGVGVRPQVVDGTDWTRYACGADPQVDMAATLLERR